MAKSIGACKCEVMRSTMGLETTGLSLAEIHLCPG